MLCLQSRWLGQDETSALLLLLKVFAVFGFFQRSRLSVVEQQCRRKQANPVVQPVNHQLLSHPA